MKRVFSIVTACRISIFCAVIFRKYSDQVRRAQTDLFRLCGTEVITVAFAPLLVMLRRGLQRLAAYAVHMPVGIDKVPPFLAAVTAGRAVKEVIGAGIGLIQKGNEVVFHGSFLAHIETELPVHCFELAACFIHASILLQFCPAVKSITGDFFGNPPYPSLERTRGESSPKSLIRMGVTALTEMPASESQVGNRFIVSAGVFHADFGFAVKAFDQHDESVDGGLGVGDVAGRHKNHHHRVLRMVTVLFPLETSIPTAFMIKNSFEVN